MADIKTPCSECGMPCTPSEFHPFAACLMFKASHSSEVVRANLDAIAEAHQAEVARLTRENEGLAKDAARYRWLRENACDQSDGYDGPELAMMTHGPGWAAEIDAAIDAALAGASGAQEGERHVDA